jgi:hypothetical protein
MEMEEKNNITAVEWLVDYLKNIKELPFIRQDLNVHEQNILNDIIEQAKEMEKQRMIDLVQQLKDYTRESNNVLGFDEREASEFVEIFYNETFKSE